MTTRIRQRTLLVLAVLLTWATAANATGQDLEGFYLTVPAVIISFGVVFTRTLTSSDAPSRKAVQLVIYVASYMIAGLIWYFLSVALDLDLPMEGFAFLAVMVGVPIAVWALVVRYV